MMVRLGLLGVAVCIVSGLSGCASGRSMIVLMPDHDGNVGTIHVETEGGSVTTSRSHEAVMLSNSSSSPRVKGVMESNEVRTTFADALRVEPMPSQVYVLYFDMEAVNPEPGSLALLDEIAAEIRARESFDVAINGHTDTTGEHAYNMEISTKRAARVLDMLVQRGIAPGIFAIDFHGEGDPLVPTADDTPEPRNRRVEVIVR